MLRLQPRAAVGVDWECPPDMDALLARMLKLRGIGSAEEAAAFLNPDEGQLADPLSMFGMADAARAVRGAIEGKRAVCVYGDYDADGVCATAILTLFLRSRGVDARAYIPSRHDEGYGLNAAAVEAIAGEGAQLLVTVDLGVGAADEVALARRLGMDVVVTDHHRPGGQLPDCAMAHPALGDYPTPHLCGAGVAFKLVEAVAGRAAALPYVDLAAIATVADVVPLIGENRAIVALGLAAINAAPRAGVAALMRAAG
ncbi:MAG: single-stranded-DNA-specific exonuclease RecJ, partial [Clostridiales bacterium]|nr:single-stranded-DNA-specific exonuclease RecJ [Clostridiales bacterium]